MEKYCDSCQKMVVTRILNTNETYEIFGEKIDVDAKVRTCLECGEQLYDEELDNVTLVNAYNIYRQRHKLLTAEEIRQIREQYGLSQRGFSKLLNWGDKTIHRYENGSLQDKAHNSLLIFLRDPQNMREYLSNNETGIDAVQKERLEKKLDDLEPEIERNNNDRFISSYFLKKPSIENGYKVFDFEKFYAAVLFFANTCDGLLKVKLLKLLNYSDMIFYKENGVSITGAQYVHLPYGPVPQHYDVLFGMLEALKIIHVDIKIDNGYEKHQIIPDCNDYESILSADEISVLQRVYKKFENFGSKEISQYAHKEIGYMETRQGEIISYDYAKNVEL